MHKWFKDRLYVIENGPGGVRWYTNGHFAMSANVVARARSIKGLKYLSELPAMRAGRYLDGSWQDENVPTIEAVIPSGPFVEARDTDLEIGKFGKVNHVFVVGESVLLMAPDYAAMFQAAPFLNGVDNVNPLCGRMDKDGPIELLVMPIRNGGEIKIASDGGLKVAA